MKWIRKGQYYKESEDKRYTVCRVTVCGVNYYEGWWSRGRSTVCIAWNKETPEEAMKECEEHAGTVAGAKESKPPSDARGTDRA